MYFCDHTVFTGRAYGQLAPSIYSMLLTLPNDFFDAILNTKFLLLSSEILLFTYEKGGCLSAVKD